MKRDEKCLLKKFCTDSPIKCPKLAPVRQTVATLASPACFFLISIAKQILRDAGTALMGIGSASGPNRAFEAARRATSSPLLDQVGLAQPTATAAL